VLAQTATTYRFICAYHNNVILRSAFLRINLSNACWFNANMALWSLVYVALNETNCAEWSRFPEAFQFSLVQLERVWTRLKFWQNI